MRPNTSHQTSLSMPPRAHAPHYLCAPPLLHPLRKGRQSPGTINRRQKQRAAGGCGRSRERSRGLLQVSDVTDAIPVLRERLAGWLAGWWPGSSAQRRRTTRPVGKLWHSQAHLTTTRSARRKDIELWPSRSTHLPHPFPPPFISSFSSYNTSSTRHHEDLRCVRARAARWFVQ